MTGMPDVAAAAAEDDEEEERGAPTKAEEGPLADSAAANDDSATETARARTGTRTGTGTGPGTGPGPGPSVTSAPASKTGPPPSGRKYQSSLPVPAWFRPASADAFRHMDMRETDVVLSSVVKAGTTWVHTILWALLHRFDDDGNDAGADGVGSAGQVYPDALPLDGDERVRAASDPDDPFRFARDVFGNYTLQDLLDQPSPRLISTHLFGTKYLPLQLLGLRHDDNDATATTDQPGKGRLVIVLRNLKDVLVSLHYFRGEARDGWLGNEHGPGSFARFLDANCSNAFGSVFDWVKQADNVVRLLESEIERFHGVKSRVCVLYYEAIKENLPGQLDRLATFLNIAPLTQAKKEAIFRAVSFDGMKQSRQKRKMFNLSSWSSSSLSSSSSPHSSRVSDSDIDSQSGVTRLPLTPSFVGPMRTTNSGVAMEHMTDMTTENGTDTAASNQTLTVASNAPSTYHSRPSGNNDAKPPPPAGAATTTTTTTTTIENGDADDILMRKGDIGDWKNHLTPEHWAAFDDVFERTLGNVNLAQPLRRYQRYHVEGMPAETRDTWTLDTDPRTWPTFVRVTLKDGMVVPDNLIARARPATTGGGGEGGGGAAAAAGGGDDAKGFVRPPSEYHGTVPSDKYPVQKGRYHLFVSGICPWASSAAVVLHLLGLNGIIDLHIADGQSGEGWVYLNGVSAPPFDGEMVDAVFKKSNEGGGHRDWKRRHSHHSRRRLQPFFLHELYRMDDPTVTSRITVPVLWDSHTRTIVSNDSWSIVKMLSFPEWSDLAMVAGSSSSLSSSSSLPLSRAAIDALGKDKRGRPTLLPPNLTDDIERVHSDLYHRLLNGVYRSGLGWMRNGHVANDAVLTARSDVTSALNELDQLLGKRRFLLGDAFTAVDVRLAMTLFRYDCSYRDAFGLRCCDRGGILLDDDDDGDDDDDDTDNADGGGGGGGAVRGAYPNLREYVRDVYGIIGGAEGGVDFRAFRQYYRIQQAIEKAAATKKETREHEKDDDELLPLPDLRAIVRSIETPAVRRFS